MLGLTMLCVTHGPQEALAVCDQVVGLDSGASRLLADIIGDANTIDGSTRIEAGARNFKAEGLRLRIEDGPDRRRDLRAAGSHHDGRIRGRSIQGAPSRLRRSRAQVPRRMAAIGKRLGPSP